MNELDIITYQQAAKRLGCTRQALEQKLKARGLPVRKLGGLQRYLTPDDLEALSQPVKMGRPVKAVAGDNGNESPTPKE